MKILGNQVLLRILPPLKTGLIEMPDDTYLPTLLGEVRGIGSDVKEDIDIMDTLLVKNFVGAPKVTIDDVEYRLYKVDDLLCRIG